MGFCGIFEHFSRFEFFLLPSIVHARPHAGTDYLQCQVFGMQFGKSIFRRSVTAARAAVFFISRRDFPFFGNASPSPNSSFGIGGISASARCPILEVPPQMKTRTAVKRRRSRFLGGEPILPEPTLAGTRRSSAYRLRPNSAMRASVSALEATRRGTSFRTKRVMSVSTPNFNKAYLANCL